MRKSDTPLDAFLPAQQFFYNSLCAGYDELVVALKDQFFQGFEWSASIVVREVADLAELSPADSTFIFPPKPPPTRSVELLKELARRVRRRFLP